MSTLAPQEILPPERLSDEQLGSLISAVGNHENKALLSVAMQPGVAYSRSDLQGLFNGIQGEQPTWLPRNLYDDNGICADLYKESRIIATLVHEFASNLSSVYVTSENGKFGDTILCDRVSIDETVTRANIFAAD